LAKCQLQWAYGPSAAKLLKLIRFLIPLPLNFKLI
jgi:hypothetical protein